MSRMLGMGKHQEWRDSGLSIPSRHPLQVWTAISFVIAVIVQMNGEPSRTAASLPSNVLLTLNIFFVIGGLFIALAALLVRNFPWQALGFELSGIWFVAAALASYVLAIAVTQGFTTSGFWWIGAMMLGFVHRGIQIGSQAWRIKRRAARGDK